MPERTIAGRNGISQDRTSVTRSIANGTQSSRSIPTRGGISTDRASVTRTIAGAVQSPAQTPVDSPAFPKSPFEILADAFTRGFGNAQYNPPLQSQAYGYTPVGGTNWGIVLILLAVGVGVFFYFRNK